MHFVASILCCGLLFFGGATTIRIRDDCHDGNCELYSSSGYRLQFLGGYKGDHDNINDDDSTVNDGFELDEMCYSYKLHEYKHKQGLSGDNNNENDNDNDFITVSIEICNKDSQERGYGVLSDYLTRVILDNPNEYDNNTNTNDDRYYVDDTHFYYVTKSGNSKGYDNNNNNNNTIISLCFKDIISNELSANIISPTEYCISHSNNNNKKLCSKRGMYVTDICGLQNENFNFAPQTSINYVPIPGKSYNVRHESVKHGLMNGRGTFALHSSLIVLRSWWIDSCTLTSLNDDSTGDKFVEISINDDYFDIMISKNVDIFDFSDMIDSPLTVPMYDQFILYKEFGNECSKIDGVIADYRHDKIAEKLVLIVDITNISPLMYFDEAKFKIKEMYLMKQFKDIVIEKEEEEDNDYYENSTDSIKSVESISRRRRRRRMLGFSKTIELPLPSFSATYDIKIGNTEIGECTPTIVPFFNIIAGMSINFGWDWFIPRLDSISGHIGVEAGVDASLTCIFGDSDINQDGNVDINIFSKDIDFVTLRASIGPIVITVTPFVSIGASISRPGLGVTLSFSSGVSGKVVAIAGWSRKRGFFGDIETEFTEPYFNFDDSLITYPGKDGRVEASFSIDIVPGLKFGLWSVDLLYVSAPIELPKIDGELGVSDNSNLCNVDEIGIDLNLNMDLTITFEFGILPIKIFGFKIFNGLSWSPQDPLFLITLDYYTHNFGCELVDNIDSSTLFKNYYASIQYQDSRFILVKSTPFELGTDESFEFSPTMTWDTANAYCMITYGTSLATIGGIDDFEIVNEFVFKYIPNTGNLADILMYQPWIGLYLDINVNGNSNENKWKWISDNSYLDPSISGSEYHSYSDSDVSGSERVCSFFSIHGSLLGTTNGIVSGDDCDTTLHDVFLCDAPDVVLKDEKYIGVYTYSTTSYDWYEANLYCNDTFGTELATILSSSDNDRIIDILVEIENQNSDRSVVMTNAWIGINNIGSSDNFTFEDGRDSITTGYTNWLNGGNSIIAGEGCGTFDYNNDGFWISSLCSTSLNTFVCNRPQAFKFFEYKDYIGVEAEGERLTFSEANDMCQLEFGTTLASIHSSNDNNDIIHIITQMEWDITQKSILGWIGLNDINIEGTFLWNDNTVFDENVYSNWFTGEPNGNGDCIATLVIDTWGYHWIDQDCDDRLNYFFCNREKTIYEYSKYVGINTHSEDDSLKYTFEEANNYCIENYGTTLASIHSSSDQADIVEIFNEIGNGYSHTWIGGTNIVDSTNFEWLDGTSVDYTAWSYNEPNNWYEDCIELRNNRNGLWNDIECDEKYSSFICNRKNSEIITNNYIGIYSYNEQYTFWEANSYCNLEYGTTLASILSENDWNEAIGIFMAFDNSSLWIGLNDDTTEENFEWVDGHSSLYTYNGVWYPGEPNVNNRDEDCVEMRSNFNGYWNDESCSSLRNGFICNQPILTYEDGYYIGVNFHHSNGDYFSWYEANDYCNINYGTTLATQMSDSEILGDIRYDELINVYNSLLITNKQAWIGLNDISTEGVYEWIDGSSGNVSPDDSHWATFEPNNYAGLQDCVSLSVDVFDNDEITFSDSYCTAADSKEYAFICNNKYNIIRYGNYIGVILMNYIVYEIHSFNWYQAENYCNTHFGTHLASIHSNDDFNDIQYIFEETSYYSWIGLHYNDDLNTFEWSDSTTSEDDDDDFDYSSLWYTNEPNDYNTNTYNNVCVYLTPNANQETGPQMVDHDCSGTNLYTFICNAQ